jgi:hypothetical protein
VLAFLQQFTAADITSVVVTDTRPVINVTPTTTTTTTPKKASPAPAVPLATTQDCTSEFKDSSVRFTHFVSLTYTPTIHDINNGYERACAFECKLNAPNVDYVIPMKVGARMSFILVQIKNIVKDSSAKEITVARSFPGIEGLKNPLKDHKVPFIAVYLHLGSEEHKMSTSWCPTKQRLSIERHGIKVEQFPFLTEVIFSFLFQ